MGLGLSLVCRREMAIYFPHSFQTAFGVYPDLRPLRIRTPFTHIKVEIFLINQCPCSI